MHVQLYSGHVTDLASQEHYIILGSCKVKCCPMSFEAFS
uniref:Uncharacterized protein n=1 Tax=Anguilla anguilla TaxID=7936 RepID=A0A0E9UC89_ANGAN